MQTILDSADRPAHDAFVEKKSEFIGDACHIDSLDDALAFVAMIREKHPKARHVAYAAVCGGSDGRLAERMSDDGEPSGTAGKPILDVLRGNEMTDCVVAVTRYFGGIRWRQCRASRSTRSIRIASQCVRSYRRSMPRPLNPA